MTPIGQAHIRFCAVNSLVDYFSGGIASNCPMKFILYGFEKTDTDFLGKIIIHAGCINIRYFLIKPFFRRAYILDTQQQFIKIVKRLIRVFQALVIQYKTLNQVFL